MKTSDQIKAEFMDKLKAALLEYGEETTLEVEGGYDESARLILTVPTLYDSDDKPIQNFAEIELDMYIMTDEYRDHVMKKERKEAMNDEHAG